MRQAKVPQLRIFLAPQATHADPKNAILLGSCIFAQASNEKCCILATA
jgi:hypothetical protein